MGEVVPLVWCSEGFYVCKSKLKVGSRALLFTAAEVNGQQVMCLAPELVWLLVEKGMRFVVSSSTSVLEPIMRQKLLCGHYATCAPPSAGTGWALDELILQLQELSLADDEASSAKKLATPSTDVVREPCPLLSAAISSTPPISDPTAKVAFHLTQKGFELKRDFKGTDWATVALEIAATSPANAIAGAECGGECYGNALPPLRAVPKTMPLLCRPSKSCEWRLVVAVSHVCSVRESLKLAKDLQRERNARLLALGVVRGSSVHLLNLSFTRQLPDVHEARRAALKPARSLSLEDFRECQATDPDTCQPPDYCTTQAPLGTGS